MREHNDKKEDNPIAVFNAMQDSGKAKLVNKMEKKEPEEMIEHNHTDSKTEDVSTTETRHSVAGNKDEQHDITQTEQSIESGQRSFYEKMKVIQEVIQSGESTVSSMEMQDDETATVHLKSMIHQRSSSGWKIMQSMKSSIAKCRQMCCKEGDEDCNEQIQRLNQQLETLMSTVGNLADDIVGNAEIQSEQSTNIDSAKNTQLQKQIAELKSERKAANQVISKLRLKIAKCKEERDIAVTTDLQFEKTETEFHAGKPERIPDKQYNRNTVSSSISEQHRVHKSRPEHDTAAEREPQHPRREIDEREQEKYQTEESKISNVSSFISGQQEEQGVDMHDSVLPPGRKSNCEKPTWSADQFHKIDQSTNDQLKTLMNDIYTLTGSPPQDEDDRDILQRVFTQFPSIDISMQHRVNMIPFMCYRDDNNEKITNPNGDPTDCDSMIAFRGTLDFPHENVARDDNHSQQFQPIKLLQHELEEKRLLSEQSFREELTKLGNEVINLEARANDESQEIRLEMELMDLGKIQEKAYKCLPTCSPERPRFRYDVICSCGGKSIREMECIICHLPTTECLECRQRLSPCVCDSGLSGNQCEGSSVSSDWLPNSCQSSTIWEQPNRYQQIKERALHSLHATKRLHRHKAFPKEKKSHTFERVKHLVNRAQNTMVKCQDERTSSLLRRIRMGGSSRENTRSARIAWQHMTRNKTRMGRF